MSRQLDSITEIYGRVKNIRISTRLLLNKELENDVIFQNMKFPGTIRNGKSHLPFCELRLHSQSRGS